LLGEFVRGGEKVASSFKQQFFTHRHEGIVVPEVNESLWLWGKFLELNEHTITTTRGAKQTFNQDTLAFHRVTSGNRFFCVGQGLSLAEYRCKTTGSSSGGEAKAEKG
jgi:hypothetical protein